MRIGICQIDCEVGDRETNLATAERYVAKAAGQGCDVVVLPEIFDMGYLLATVASEAATTLPEPVAVLSDIAKRHQVHIVAGIAEATEGTVYNAIVSIRPTGERSATYRKTHLVTAAPMHEEKHLGEGSDFVLDEIAGIRCGFMTCYDVRFPEVARTLALRGAELVILPSAFPLVRLPHWNVLVPARAIENQVYVVACNRVGTDGPGLTFCGTSMVVDPYGTIAASASAIDEDLLVVEIDPERAIQVRDRMKIRQDRRPELYGELVR